MSGKFLDTNIIVYALGNDDKGLIAREIYQGGARTGIQSLNEFANVARRKLKLGWDELEMALADIRRRCPNLIGIDQALQEDGIRLARRYGFSIYDGLMVAAALRADCDILYSEDMHDGLVVDGRLQIVNPFKSM